MRTEARKHAAVLDDEEKSHGSKNGRNVAKRWKSHETDLPRDSLEGSWHFCLFDFSPGKLILDDPKCVIVSREVCCFKIPSLGLFVKTGMGY